jgi:hypothetical protein
MENTMTTGSCLCGAVRYEASGPYRWMAHCHCSMCRKQHGSLYGTSVGVDPKNFRWLQGEDAIVHYRSSASFQRPFCRHCGSALPDASGEHVVCPAGGLDESLEMKPQAHIFVGSKSPMCEITDSLLQFEEYPPGYGAAVEPKAPPAAPEGVIQGSCLCGEVAFSIDETPTKFINCHCSRCRRSRGAAHGTNFFVHSDKLRWLRGADRVSTFKLPEASMFSTGFCSACGSLIPSLFDTIGRYIVPVGALDTPLTARPGLNIHVGSKAPWFEITDHLRQFESMPPRERIAELFF